MSGRRQTAGTLAMAAATAIAALLVTGCTGSSGDGGSEPAAEVSSAATTAPPPPARLFVSTTGSDAGPCDEGSPCLTFDRAYQLAVPGDVVQVGAGKYPEQRIDPRPAARDGVDPVVFRPAPGAKVELDYLYVAGSNVEVSDLATVGWSVQPGAENITLRNLDTSAQSIIASARQVRVIGGDIGPVSSGDGIQIKPRDRGEPSPDDILIDGVRFHDVTGPADGQHRDCIQVGGATNLVVRNSSFERCADRDIIMGTFLGGVFGPTLIENNFFGPTVKSSVSVDAREAAVDLTFRYNSIGAHGVIIGTNNQRARGNRVVGNVGPLSSAHSGPGTCEQPSVATYSHNVWTNAKCSSTDRRAPSGYVNQAALDYRLAPGSAAIRAGDPNDHPERDIFGSPRGVAGPPDAGAHELSSSPAGGAPGGSAGSSAAGQGAGLAAPGVRAPRRYVRGRWMPLRLAPSPGAARVLITRSPRLSGSGRRTSRPAGIVRVPLPRRDGPVTFTVRYLDASGRPLGGAKARVIVDRTPPRLGLRRSRGGRIVRLTARDPHGIRRIRVGGAMKRTLTPRRPTRRVSTRLRLPRARASVSVVAFDRAGNATVRRLRPLRAG